MAHWHDKMTRMAGKRCREQIAFLQHERDLNRTRRSILAAIVENQSSVKLSGKYVFGLGIFACHVFIAPNDTTIIGGISTGVDLFTGKVILKVAPAFQSQSVLEGDRPRKAHSGLSVNENAVHRGLLLV